MAGKKNPRSSKTDHVLNLLTDSSAGSASSNAPADPAASDTPTLPADPIPVPVSKPKETVSDRHLSPPILEVARTSNEALEETIHGALEEALQEELSQEEETTPEPASPSLQVEEGTDADMPAQPPAGVDQPEGELPTPRSASAEPDSPETSLPAEAPVPEPVSSETVSPAETLTPEPPADEAEESSSTPPESDSDVSPQSLPFYFSLPDGARFVNVMLPLVDETLERYVTLFHLCHCPRCFADAKALALSRLPAKYVVLSEGAFTPMMSLYRAKFDSMVTTQVVYACKQIMDAPRHVLES